MDDTADFPNKNHYPTNSVTFHLIEPQVPLNCKIAAVRATTFAHNTKHSSSSISKLFALINHTEKIYFTNKKKLNKSLYKGHSNKIKKTLFQHLKYSQFVSACSDI